MNAVRLPATEATRESSLRGAASQAAVSHVLAGDNCSEQLHGTLGECVSRTVRRYLDDIGDTPCQEGLHALVLREVEGPMLREVLAFHGGNQSRAATALGINRATLRKKLAAHGLL